MASSKKSTKKASSSGGVSAQAIQRVLREAKPVEDTGGRAGAAAAAPAAIPNFCAVYRSRIRPILLAIIAFLKFFRKAWAEALAAAVAFLDGICGGEE